MSINPFKLNFSQYINLRSVGIAGCITAVPSAFAYFRSNHSQNTVFSASASHSTSSLQSALQTISPSSGINDRWHRVFLTTNEAKAKNTLDTLAATPIKGDAMIGVSGFFILNAAAQRTKSSDPSQKIKKIIVLDRSSRVEHFWEHVKEIICEASAREEVFENLLDLLEKEKNRYYGESDLDFLYYKQALKGLDRDVKAHTSWLSDDLRFKTIQEIFKNDGFIFRRINLSDDQKTKSIHRILEEHGLAVDTLYLSNVADYMENAEEKDRFIQTVRNLTEKSTLIIHAQAEIDSKTEHPYPAASYYTSPLTQCVQSASSFQSIGLKCPK